MLLQLLFLVVEEELRLKLYRQHVIDKSIMIYFFIKAS